MKKAISALIVLSVFTALFLCGCGKDTSETATVNSLAYKVDEVESFARENGFDFTVHNGDAEFMTDELRRQEFVYSLGTTVIRNVFSLIDSKEYSYIKNIKRSEYFTEITVLVNQKKYEKAKKGDEISNYIGMNCLVYLKYEDMEASQKKCLVKIADSESEMILKETLYTISEGE